MPLSLPPPVASSLSDLLLYTFRQGGIVAQKNVNAALSNKSPFLCFADEPLPPEILDGAHLEVFLQGLEKLLLDCHHHTPQSPLSTNQSSATFPPPLDSQDQL